MFVAYWAFPLVFGAKILIDASGVLIYVIIIAAREGSDCEASAFS
jgi:hypothetical protein